MRIDLKTPFAEKDQAKALGARWDAGKKLWYITDVADLTPFMRWIPDVVAATQASATQPPGRPAPRTQAPAKAGNGVITTPAAVLTHCGCQTLPWLDCAHTSA